MIEYVELAVARTTTTGVRLVVSGLVPSPWSEAAKGLFRVAKVPVMAVRSVRGNPELLAWTGIDNVPVVFHEAEPARTGWAAITALAARLAGPGVLLPVEPLARARAMGLIEMIAGEDGLGWLGRHAMIDASLDHGRGFSPPVAQYLARRYAHAPVDRARVAAQLAILHDHLREQQARGHAYLGGAAISAVDVYAATFLTPMAELTELACPRLTPPLRAAFATAREALGELVSPELMAHRMMILEHHLGWPIEI